MSKKADESVKEAQQASNMKGAFVALLMIPVLVALVAGAWFTTKDVGQGLPLLLGGVVLGVFNVLVLRYLFKRLATMDQETQADAGEGARRGEVDET